MQKLREQDTLPTPEVLEEALRSSYEVYCKFIETIEGDEFELECQWNYYKDGKAWLCKVCNKKKTILWLSIWDSYFKLGFHFTEKTRDGVMELNIDKKIKETFKNTERKGRLIALILDVSKEVHLKDAYQLILYKKSLK